MIEPDFLSRLRGQLRCELLVTLVQLEQRCPGWWLTQDELAGDLGIQCTPTLCNQLSQLRRAGLIAYHSRGNHGGMWLWWVKRHQEDTARRRDAPGWRLRDSSRRTYDFVPVDGVKGWAKRHHFSYATVREFLAGRRVRLGRRWEVASSPYDNVDPAFPAPLDSVGLQDCSAPALDRRSPALARGPVP
jgi:hypothetical protein